MMRTARRRPAVLEPSMRATSLLAICTAPLALAMAATAWSAPVEKPPASGEWNFIALLDGDPIGIHRYTVTAKGDERQVVSDAEFAVKMLGFTAYRYRHHAEEQWQGDCLTSLSATTDDDGKALAVHGEKQGDEFVVKATDENPTVKGCVMTFAYWNPALQGQTRLINAQTGRLETVQVQRTGSAPIDVHGKPVVATRYRITGPKQPIDVWYGPEGEWVGLDSIVAGGRKLSYRLP